MSNELYHHGVKGMKWGVRHDPEYTRQINRLSASGQRKKIRNDRRARDKAIQKEYDRAISKIEAPYKRGQNLSDKDYKLELAADNKARKAWADSKAQYKAEMKKSTSNGGRIERSVQRGQLYAEHGGTGGTILASGIVNHVAIGVGTAAAAGVLSKSGKTKAAYLTLGAGTLGQLGSDIVTAQKVIDRARYNDPRYEKYRKK